MYPRGRKRKMSNDNLVRQVQGVLKQCDNYDQATDVLATVIISMGCSMVGHNGPITNKHIDDWKKEYYSKPTLGHALLLQGLTMRGWGSVPPTKEDKENKED